MLALLLAEEIVGGLGELLPPRGLAVLGRRGEGASEGEREGFDERRIGLGELPVSERGDEGLEEPLVERRAPLHLEDAGEEGGLHAVLSKS